MWPALEDGVARGFSLLLAAFFAWCAFILGEMARKNHGAGWRTALRALGWSIAAAAFFAVIKGPEMDCTDSDPLFGGGCEPVPGASDPTRDERFSTFGQLVILFGIPAWMGAISKER
jgi:hypothetical protein